MKHLFQLSFMEGKQSAKYNLIEGFIQKVYIIKCKNSAKPDLMDCKDLSPRASKVLPLHIFT